jgi:ferric-dicitrate binding protein FerR (iron transport regulator)
MDPQPHEWPTQSAERLRRALEPSPEHVERLIRTALSPLPQRRAGSTRLLAALASAAALAGVLTSALPDRFGSVIREESPARVAISNQGDIVIARRPDAAGGWLVRSGPAPATEPSQLVIVHYGEKP